MNNLEMYMAFPKHTVPPTGKEAWIYYDMLAATSNFLIDEAGHY